MALPCARGDRRGPGSPALTPRLRFRPLPVLSAASLAALLLLVALGAWQWQRFLDKSAARAATPEIVTLSRAEPLAGGVQLVYSVGPQGPVWRVFAPVRQGGRVTFLDTAAIPGLQPPDWRTAPTPFTGPFAVRGVKMVPKPNAPFTPKPDPARRLWYGIDLEAMAARVGAGPTTPFYLALPYVGPDGAAVANPFARPLDTLPPERHLGYAATWWGLALALVAVYAAFHARAGRLTVVRRQP